MPDTAGRPPAGTAEGLTDKETDTCYSRSTSSRRRSADPTFDSPIKINIFQKLNTFMFIDLSCGDQPGVQPPAVRARQGRHRSKLRRSPGVRIDHPGACTGKARNCSRHWQAGNGYRRA